MTRNPNCYSSLLLDEYVEKGDLKQLLTNLLFKALPPREKGEIVCDTIINEPHIPSDTKNIILVELLVFMNDLRDLQEGFSTDSNKTIEQLNENINDCLKTLLQFYMILLSCIDGLEKK